MGQDRIERLKGLSLNAKLKDKEGWDELAIALVWSWQEKSVELKKLRLLDNKHLQNIDLKKVWSWQEKSVELIKGRNKTLIATLLLAIAPSTVDDVTDILGYKSKPRFREDYLKPLRDSRLIEYTSEQANAPNQKYRITQRGINFLMGSAI